MKEISLTLRLHNNRLRQRREELGMNQSMFAKAAGVSLGLYRELECLRMKPQRENGTWREIASRLADFHCVEPEELFPPTVLAVETPVVTRQFDGNDLLPLLTQRQEWLLEEGDRPDSAYERKELSQALHWMLDALPPRQAEALRLRFGIGDDTSRTLEEIGDILGVSKKYVSSLQTHALQTMYRRWRIRKIQGEVEV